MKVNRMSYSQCEDKLVELAYSRKRSETTDSEGNKVLLPVIRPQTDSVYCAHLRKRMEICLTPNS